MRIQILGGSNSGPHIGWASYLAELAPEHQVDNRFLGAVGSLFGLLRLLKMRHEGEARPDLVVFEYGLNDSLWMAGGSVTSETVRETLHDVATVCAQERIRLLFLCLSLPPAGAQGQSPGSRHVDDLYRHVAASRGLAPCLLLQDIVGPLRADLFRDPLHLAPAPARMVAQAVVARLRQPTPIPRGARRRLAFDYIDARAARVSGPGRYVSRMSSVFDGPFVELARGGASYWMVEGRLAGVMLRSTALSGYYRARLRARALRKNAQSAAREDVGNLMTLHYVDCREEAGPELIIDMPSREETLAALPHDHALMEAQPLAPFDDQTLEINGVMIRRRRSVWRRLLDAVATRLP